VLPTECSAEPIVSFSAPFLKFTSNKVTIDEQLSKAGPNSPYDVAYGIYVSYTKGGP